MAEEKKKGGLKGMYKGKGEKKPEPKPEAKPAAEPAKPAADAAPSAPEMPKPGAGHEAARMGMHKRHEVELRDAHGNHRDNLRKIVARQGKEIKEMQAMHEAEMAGAAAQPGTGNDPSAAGAGGQPTAPVPAGA